MSKNKINKGILNGLEEMNKNSNSNIDSNIDSNGNIILNKKKYKADKHIQRLFYITEELDIFLDQIKKKTGRDRSEIVRLALNHFKNNLQIKE